MKLISKILLSLITLFIVNSIAAQGKPASSAEIVNSSSEKLVYTIAKNKVILSWEKWNIPFKVK